MAPTRSLPITCPKYQPVPGTKRCAHFQANGACDLPDELMCVEWLKVNRVAPTPPPEPAPLQRNLLGEPMPMVPPPREKPALPTPARPGPAPIVHTLSDVAIASFKALGTEVCFVTDELGEVWLVPEYTGQNRQELSIEHAALLAAVGSTMPGACLTAIRRKPMG